MRSAMPVESRATARPASPGSTSSLRTANQRRVMALLQSEAGHTSVSQAEIARRTGLAPATVSTIVRDLVAGDLLETETGSGRRGTTVRISRRAGLVVGVDIGHRHLRVAVGDYTGDVLAHERHPLSPEHTPDEALAVVAGLIEGLTTGLGVRPDAVGGVGIGLPTPLDLDGVLTSATLLPGWHRVHVKAEATRVLGVPVHVDNDANLGALAEYRRGAGVGHPDLIFVKVSAGVGAGLVLSGELFRGAAGLGGELGHLTYNEQGPLCRCGSRGCLEVYTSVIHAKEMMADQLPDATIDEIVQAAQQGSSSALRVLEDAGLHLGWGVAMAANLINPSAVVVGGDMARAGDLFLDWVRVGLRRHALPAVAAGAEVRLAELGDRASVIGALLLAVSETELIR